MSSMQESSQSFLSQYKIIISIVVILFFATVFGHLVPSSYKVFFYTISNLIRKGLLFLLPFLVFPFMVSSISALRSRGVWMVGGIMLMIVVSNFTAIMGAFFAGNFLIPQLGGGRIATLAVVDELMPLFDVPLSPLVGMEVTLLVAFISGLGVGFINNRSLDSFFEKYTAASTFFFENIFIPILPLYVLGTILKITYETDLGAILPTFGSMALGIVFIQSIYISFLFFMGAGFSITGGLKALKNALPAGLVGLTTMSSFVTMPVTLKVAEKNTGNPHVARVAISTTVNCHCLGEAISLPLIAMTIYFITFSQMPSLSAYFPFALLLTIAQFSAVAVPGGSIVVMLPFLERYLSFSSEMVSLIIALSIFMDPVGTGQNVMANSAFAMIINKLNAGISNLKGKFSKVK
jgi:Na+/H+-dicarboxylate symporter